MSGISGNPSESAERVELHVLFVPDDQFDRRLNKASAAAVDSFVSAGFIRVDSDMSLCTLRSELGPLLGLDQITEKFVFLKCLGRSLALVKYSQERELSVKSFTPPFAHYPEIYLLPVIDHESGVCSSSFTTDTSTSYADHLSQDLSKATCARSKTKEPVKFPSINKGPQHFVLMDNSERDESDKEAESACNSLLLYSSRENLKTLKIPADTQLTKKQGHSLTEMKTAAKKKHFRRNKNNPRVLEEFEDSCEMARKSNSSTTLKWMEESDHETDIERPPSPLPESSSPLSVYSLELCTQHKTTRDELMEEIKSLKEQRKELEKTRQELLKRGRELIALNRHRRNQARDRWKRQYFETKKATAVLEDTLKRIQQELHAFYDKMLQQLQARDGAKHRSKAKQISSSKIKNELIIQIMTENSEIDNLRKNVDDAQMKLATEVKLRNQAATELQTLRAELMQKRAQM